MNEARYRWILYIILVVILSTIGIQVYWNYKNYLMHKQQLVNDVQLGLDNALETYFANIIKENTVEVGSDSIFIVANFDDQQPGLRAIMRSTDSLKSIEKLDSVPLDLINRTFKNRSGERSYIRDFIRTPSDKDSSHMENDSLFRKRIRRFTDRIMISVTRDTLALEEIDSLFKTELKRKKIDINYALTFKRRFQAPRIFGDETLLENSLSTQSKSSLLRRGSFLKINFANETKVILQRIFWSVFISLILVLAVIACLFYLLHIIKHQKQLAAVKNDLISNITHEFKTPIATIGVALESIKNFNVIEDKKKTQSYLEMSSNQLSKLNLMVEKLLETASLDSNNLELNTEVTNVIPLLQSIISKHQFQAAGKSLILDNSKDEIFANVDVFHFENAINNIIDNAIKYGGDKISVKLEKQHVKLVLLISDNGTSLTQTQKNKVFEQFYRVPTGNTHDVKGFGIGLFYTKKIIEKHGGQIELLLNDKLTTFKITLPNA